MCQAGTTRAGVGPLSTSAETVEGLTRAALAALLLAAPGDHADSQRAATARNLEAVGYTGYAELIIKTVDMHYVSAADFKAPQRARIEAQGYTVIHNLRGQPRIWPAIRSATFQLPNRFYRIP